MVSPGSAEAEHANMMRCIANTVIVGVGAALSVAFAILLTHDWWRTAGILEWILGNLGAVWLFTFVGILR
jgi:hypothetical protein